MGVQGKTVDKAKNLKEAFKKIKMLSGKKHYIYTSIYMSKNKKKIWSHTEKTTVIVRKLKNKDIFFGHWSTLRGFKIKHVYPMDHGCIWGDKLSAFRTEDRTLISQKSIEDI